MLVNCQLLLLGDWETGSQGVVGGGGVASTKSSLVYLGGLCVPERWMKAHHDMAIWG